MLSSAAGGPVLRDRLNTLEMACNLLAGSVSCVSLYVCAAWAAFGSYLKGLNVVGSAAGPCFA